MTPEEARRIPLPFNPVERARQVRKLADEIGSVASVGDGFVGRHELVTQAELKEVSDERVSSLVGYLVEQGTKLERPDFR